MPKDKMIKPFVFLKPNQCPKCRGRMILVEEESYISKPAQESILELYKIL